jgi:hypothetical protein
MKKTTLNICISINLLFLLTAVSCNVLSFAMEINQENISLLKEEQNGPDQKKSIIDRINQAIKKEIGLTHIQKTLFLLSGSDREDDDQQTVSAQQESQNTMYIDVENKMQNTIEKELGSDSVQLTPHKLWLAISNKTAYPYKTPVKFEVRNTQKNLIEEIIVRPGREYIKHFNFERITYALSSFKAYLYDNKRTLLLKLTASRLKNPSMASHLLVRLNSKKMKDGSISFDKRMFYDTSEDNYLIILNLNKAEKLYADFEKMNQENEKNTKKILKDELKKKELDLNYFGLQGSHMDVKPVTQKVILLEAKINRDTKDINGLKKVERTSSVYF